MTDIPGTGKPSYEVEKETAEKELKAPPLSVVNVSEIKKNKSDIPRPGDELWYNQLRWWILSGSLLSVIFVLLGFFFDPRFYLMVPAGPTIAFLTWNLRKWLRRYEEKADVLFK